MDDDAATQPLQDIPQAQRDDPHSMIGKLVKPWHDGGREVEDTAL